MVQEVLLFFSFFCKFCVNFCIFIVGNGIAGMLRMTGYQDVTIIEPKSVLFYQPLWTLVGGGLKKIENSSKPLRITMSPSAKLITNSVKTFDPDNNQLILEDDTKISYDYLIVATGINCAYEKIPGLVEALDDEKSGVVSIYDYNYANKTSTILNQINNEGRSIFTSPTTPVNIPFHILLFLSFLIFFMLF